MILNPSEFVCRFYDFLKRPGFITQVTIQYQMSGFLVDIVEADSQPEFYDKSKQQVFGQHKDLFVAFEMAVRKLRTHSAQS